MNEGARGLAEWRMRRRRWFACGLLVATAVCTTAVPGAASPRAAWVPSATDRFQVILSTTPTAAQLHGAFSAMEVDGFETPSGTVASLHALGKHAVCYMDAGTWERWRPDAGKFPRSVLGEPDAGWPGERWLDIRKRSVLLPIMRARFDVCKAKGFDAVDPDNVDGVENATGFKLTKAEQYAYDEAIASLAHADGLAVALKSYAAGASVSSRPSTSSSTSSA